MDPTLAAAVGMIAAALATAILRAAAYYWPSGYHKDEDAPQNNQAPRGRKNRRSVEPDYEVPDPQSLGAPEDDA